MSLKSSVRTFLTTDSRGELGADGLLLTAGAFGALAGVAFLIEWLTPGSIETASPALGFVIWLFTVAGFLVGPLLAWKLHGRHFDGRGILAVVIGLFVGGAVMQATAMVVAGLSYLVGLLFSGEFTGPLIMLTILAAAALGVVVWIMVDAVRDLSASRRNHVALDVWRIVALTAVIAFVIGSVLRQIAVPNEGVIEADVFMLAGGVVGGATVMAADFVAGLMSRRSGAQVPVAG